MLANAARGEDAVPSTYRRNHIDAEAERAAERCEFLCRAGAAFAIGEVVPHDYVACSEPCRDNVGGKGFSAQGGERLIEGDNKGLIEAESLKKLELQGKRRQIEERLAGHEEL